MTHGDVRHGTTTLFAASNSLDGTVISTCQERHRHDEWLKFFRLIDKSVPADLEIHLIADNYRTDKHEKVQRWLARQAVSYAFHADERIMVEYRRALLSRSDDKAYSPRNFCFNRAAYRGDRRLYFAA